MYKAITKGFTLIELLVVIIIIGILAAIAIPVFLNQREKATEASIKSDLRTVANQMETYFADHQTYPAPTSGAPTAGQIVIGGTTVKLSSGNVGMMSSEAAVAGQGSYCILVMNTEIGPGSATYYNSSQGGILPKGSGCGTPTPAPTN